MPERIETNHTPVEHIRETVQLLIHKASTNFDSYWKNIKELHESLDLLSEVCHFIDEYIEGRQSVSFNINLFMLQGLRMEFDHHPNSTTLYAKILREHYYSND